MARFYDTDHAQRRPRWRLAAALMMSSAASALVVAPAYAQQADASLRGTITDGGAPVQGEVTAVNVETGYRRSAPVTGGAYNFASLSPGSYRLEVQAGGVTKPTDVFTLAVGQNAELSFDLAQTAAAASGETETTLPGAAGGNIVVTSDRIQSLSGGAVGVTITQHQIEALPQNNRNFLAFADLAPGVQFNTAGNGNQSLQGGAQRGDAVNVFIDGVSQKDYVLKNGITGQDSSQGNPFPQLGIAEYKVISQNYKAEFLGVSSVAITAVTKSGTNEFHGNAFFDFSNQDLRAKTPAEKHDDKEKVDTKDMQFGAALGGPIIKDVLHFFVTYEGKRQTTPVVVAPPAQVDISTIPEEYRSNYGNFNRTFNEDLYFAKIDFSPTSSDLFELSGKIRRESGLAWNNGVSAKSYAGNIRNNETRGLLRWQHTADTWINDARLSYAKAFWNPTPYQNGTAITFQTGVGGPDRPTRAGILNFGAGLNYQNKGQEGWTLQDDFTYTGFVGHTIKLGARADWTTLKTLQFLPYNPHYFYNVDYAGDPDGFNDTIPWQLQFGVPVAGSAGGAARSKDFQLGLYIQDDWDVTDRLTLNIGVRWDYEHNPAYLNFVTPPEIVDALLDYHNLDNADYDVRDYISDGNSRKAFTGAFQPRFGFTWDVTEDGRYQLFGGYGRSYNRNQFDFLSLEMLKGTFKSVTFLFDNNDPAHSCGPQCIPWDPIYLTQEGRDSLATSTTGAGGEIDIMSNDLKVPYSDQFSLGARGRFGRLRAEIGYTHVESRDGFAFLLGSRYEDGAFFHPGKEGDTARPPFGHGVPNYAGPLLGTNGVETNLDTIYLKLNKDYSVASPWSVNVTYTFSLAEENRKFGEHYSLDFPTMDDYPWLRSAGVPKHRVVATGSVDLPLGLMLSGKLLLESPPYIYGIRKADVPDTENYPGVPVTTEGRNKHPFLLGDLWAIRQLDLALTKYIPLNSIYDGARLRLRADVFNVFNTANRTAYVGNANSPDFGLLQPNNYATGGYPPRTVKFTVGLSF